MKKRIIIFLVTFLNPWMVRIFQKSIILGILLGALSILLFFCTAIKKRTKYKKFIIVIFLFIGFITLKQGFNNSILETNTIEKGILLKRHEYFAKEYKKLYGNRIGIYYYQNIYLPLKKIEQGIFHTLDPNLYFFASHPRERGGVEEFEKYPFILLPFFLWGLMISARRTDLYLLYYFMAAVLLSAFLATSYFLGPVLLFPFMNSQISLGLEAIVNTTKKYIKR